LQARSVKDGNNRVYTGIVAEMAARSGDAAAEGQLAPLIVKHRLTRSCGAKCASFAARIQNPFHARNPSHASPKVGLSPVGRKSRRLDEDYERLQPLRCMRHEHR
jgi:hypothetical protein